LPGSVVPSDRKDERGASTINNYLALVPEFALCIIYGSQPVAKDLHHDSLPQIELSCQGKKQANEDAARGMGSS
jgi:hypothetical protein